MTPPRIPTTADIVVAGGGPAGATIARLLAGFGFQVVVFEKRRFPRHQIGESLTPHILPVLDFLGMQTRIEAAGFLRMAGHTACWGGPQPRTAFYSPDHSRLGFQVWREDFDRLLLEHARTGGVQVVEGQPVESIEVENGTGMTVRYAPHGHIAASFFIDASGHAGLLARQAVRRRDVVFQTLALTAYWQQTLEPAGIDRGNTVIEAYPDGMVWSVPLHNGLRNVTFLVDWYQGNHIRQAGLRQFYLSELQKVSYVASFLAGAQLARPPAAFDASLYTAQTFAHKRFLLVGDAGLFIDPLSSEGVHKAMASAITGAVVVNTILQRPHMTRHAIQLYEHRQQQTYTEHYRQSVRYYREERRWAERPFWQRRSQLPLPQFAPASTRHSTPTTQKISHLYLTPGVTIESRGVVEGSYVELREVAVAPAYPYGVRFLHGINVPVLLEAVGTHPAVADIIPAYLQRAKSRGCTPESIRQVLARLYQEGVLTPTAPTEIRSG